MPLKKNRYPAPSARLALLPLPLLPLPLLPLTLLLLAGCAGGRGAMPPMLMSMHIAHGNVRVIAVGDVMIGTAFPGPEYLNPAITPEATPADLLGPELAALLGGGDVVFGNLEGTLYDGDGPTKPCANPERCYAFRSPTWYARLLADTGFNMMSLANNHGGDFLETGRLSTMLALEDNSIAYAGVDSMTSDPAADGTVPEAETIPDDAIPEGGTAMGAGGIPGAPAAVPVFPDARTASLSLVDGTRVGLAAFAPNKGTVSLYDLDAAAASVTELARQNHIVLVSVHSGAEGAAQMHVPRTEELYAGEGRGDVYAFAHHMIDAGAHMVIGHGPHVPRGVEIYKGRLIAYSLGNFWTWGRFNLRGPNGVAPVLEAELSPTGNLVKVRVHSVVQVDWGIPRLDPQQVATRLVAELTGEDFPEARLSFAPDGTVSGPGTDTTTPPPALPVSPASVPESP
ncbi:MAG: CapA family protein [Nitrospirota bacterium]|nr:CapA family protein [Nitrospirota bacterium]